MEFSKDKIQELEFCKKGRFTDSYLDVKDLVVIWKDYLDQFDDLLKSNDFCSDYTCTC